MTTPAKYSERNIVNSVAALFATQLLAAGYLVYWHQQDAVETADGWYPEYSTKQDQYAVNATFAGRLAAAKGLVTLRGKTPTNPTFVTRPTNSGTVAGQSEIPVPAFAIEVGAMTPIRNAEVGIRAETDRPLKFRARHLIVQGFTRTDVEQSLFSDYLGQWLDEDVAVDVADHDAGSTTPFGTVDVTRPTIIDDIVIEGPEATTFAVEMHARLTYEA